MQCKSCVHWVVEGLTYSQLRDRWDEVVSAEITAGHKRRFEKESKRTGVPFDQVVLSYKYCAAGRMNKFYIAKSIDDTKPVRLETNCPFFSTSTDSIREFPVPSPLWTYCATEVYRPPVLRGLEFVQGLYERGCFKVPAHGKIQPQIIAATLCSVCGKSSDKGIEVREVKQFCCNRHYLQWWAEQHPELFQKWQNAKGL
ncbi:MAG: hypothetical protein KKA54_20835 [Proteobacteria bacterium]|nr:hypothetical protein [Pseudomonadota bacterium]